MLSSMKKASRPAPFFLLPVGIVAEGRLPDTLCREGDDGTMSDRRARLIASRT
jgi:hypothetical protein